MTHLVGRGEAQECDRNEEQWNRCALDAGTRTIGNSVSVWANFGQILGKFLNLKKAFGQKKLNICQLRPYVFLVTRKRKLRTEGASTTRMSTQTWTAAKVTKGSISELDSLLDGLMQHRKCSPRRVGNRKEAQLRVVAVKRGAKGAEDQFGLALTQFTITSSTYCPPPTQFISPGAKDYS